MTKQEAQAKLGCLSDRERQIAILLADGLPPRQIAKRLKLSTKTVATYRARTLKKLDLKFTRLVILIYQAEEIIA